MKIREQYLSKWRGIAAITPYYQKNGRSGSQIHYSDGYTEFYNYRCDWIAKQLAQKFGTTMELSRQMAGQVLDSANIRKPPLVMHENFCLVPLKLRNVPKGRNVSTLGYVVLQYVKKLEHAPDGNTTVLFHKSTPPLHILQRVASVERQMNLAWMVQEQFDETKRKLHCEAKIRWVEAPEEPMIVEAVEIAFDDFDEMEIFGNVQKSDTDFEDYTYDEYSAYDDFDDYEIDDYDFEEYDRYDDLDAW